MKIYIRAAVDTINLPEDDYERWELAKSPNLSLDILSVLSRDPDVSIVKQIAQRTDCPTDILSELALNKTPSVRYHVAKNPNTSSLDIEKLLSDKQDFVRKAVAKRTDLTDDQYYSLAQDPDASVRKAVAKNSAVSNEILEFLENDENSEIVEAIQSRLYNKKSNRPELLKLAKTSTDPKELENLANSRYYSIRKAVASNPHTSSKALDIIADISLNKVYNVGSWAASDLETLVASNPNVSLDTINKIAFKTGYYQPLQAISTKPNLPEDIYYRLANEFTCYPYLANNPSTPVNILNYILYQHGGGWCTSDEVRQRVADRLHIPDTVLDGILNDDNEEYEKYNRMGIDEFINQNPPIYN